jgi:hypothetical protein
LPTESAVNAPAVIRPCLVPVMDIYAGVAMDALLAEKKGLERPKCRSSADRDSQGSCQS